MPPRTVGGTGLNECPGCNGVWAPGASFDQLIARALEARRDADPVARAGLNPRLKGANPSAQKVEYRRCPECEAFMQRRNFRKSSGVIIEVCQRHGTWLDADELERIAGFLLSGGTPSPTLRSPERVSLPPRAAAELARRSWPRECNHESFELGRDSLVDLLIKFLK